MRVQGLGMRVSRWGGGSGKGSVFRVPLKPLKSNRVDESLGLSRVRVGRSRP